MGKGLQNACKKETEDKNKLTSIIKISKEEYTR